VSRDAATEVNIRKSLIFDSIAGVSKLSLAMYPSAFRSMSMYPKISYSRKAEKITNTYL